MMVSGLVRVKQDSSIGPTLIDIFINSINIDVHCWLYFLV